MSRFFLIFILIIVALIAVVISTLNPRDVELELAFAHFTSPLGLTLIVAFTAGLLAGLAWQVKWVAQLLAERGRLRRALRLAESRARKEVSDKA